MCESSNILLGFLAVFLVLIAAVFMGVSLGAVLERNRKPWLPKPNSPQAIDRRHRERKERRRGDA